MVVCGNFFASRDDFHKHDLLHVTVPEEPSSWLTADSQQSKHEINLLCAGQREGEIVGFHLERTEATRVKSSTTMATTFCKDAECSPYFLVTRFSKGRLTYD